MKSRTLTMMAGALTAVTGACLSGGGARPIDCGAGDGFRYAGVDYCIFGGAIIIEGFDCPAAAPFAFEADGAVVCSPSETPPDGGWSGIVDAWRDDQNPSPVDASGDSEIVIAPRTACDVTLDRPIGQRIPVVDVGECPIERRCDDGVVARCDNGLWACDCSYGDMRCAAIPELACPTHGAGAGAACLAELGADACAPGLFCAEDARCAALPAICQGGCFDDGDCAGACAGGSRVAGRLGRCVAAPLPGGCWDASDCPAGWTCEGVSLGCAPCASCSNPIDDAGTCRAPGDAIGLVTDHAGRVHALWWLTGIYALVDCPSFTLVTRDETTGAWSDGSAESACSGPASPPSTTPFARLAPELPPSAFSWTWVRARGSYYLGCTGATPDSCSSGPVEIVSEPRLIVP